MFFSKLYDFVSACPYWVCELIIKPITVVVALLKHYIDLLFNKFWRIDFVSSWMLFSFKMLTYFLKSIEKKGEINTGALT